MRTFGKMFALACVALAAANLAGGQPPQPVFQPGFGKAKGGDYFNLVQNPQIKDELKITQEQLDKLPAAALKVLAEILDQKQVARLKEISLQQKGNGAFLDVSIRKDLKISDEQVKKIQDAMDNMAKEQNDMFQSGNFDFEQIQALQTKTNETIQGVLTADQKSAFAKLTGEPFVLKGGFGGGKGGFGKKG